MAFQVKGLVPRDLGAADPAGSVDGGLHVRAEVDDVDDELQVELRLPLPSGRRACQNGLTFAADDEVVEGYARVPVRGSGRVAARDREASWPTVVQDDARRGAYLTSAEGVRRDSGSSRSGDPRHPPRRQSVSVPPVASSVEGPGRARRDDVLPGGGRFGDSSRSSVSAAAAALPRPLMAGRYRAASAKAACLQRTSRSISSGVAGRTTGRQSPPE